MTGNARSLATRIEGPRLVCAVLPTPMVNGQRGVEDLAEAQTGRASRLKETPHPVTLYTPYGTEDFH